MRFIQLSAASTALLACLALAGGCEEQTRTEQPRLVKTMVAAASADAAHPSLTGQVNAHTYVSASFRVSGQITRRLVSAGDRVAKGQPLAELDDTILRNTLRSAQAEVAASQAALVQADQHAARVRGLLKERAVSKESSESAIRQLKSARAQLAASKAQQASAEEQLGYAVLYAEADGVIVERYAESGEVVAAGQAVYRIALDGGRDAVFDLPDRLFEAVSPGSVMQVCLDRRRGICSAAEVYEVSPEADSATRTYRTKARIAEPRDMDLGATLVGRLEGSETAIRLPASALCSVEGQPSVWVVDTQALTVSLRPVEIGAYSTDRVVIRSGLAEGDVVVTAGVQLLREGQTVRMR
ncbi:MAG: efflux RND transporter periplasmic adaptor subunit [Desulfovibrionaceae bacterium]|nr:efflux RND transporter periplasmic adaptor subunit [Desulfovibrionaceae bacterium]